ncbi:MAG: preprotein translocase subunit SecE [Lachnospiraceae bacterium]|nr:preprotein translocase subunit SecE [Lachnospiraceae bacterium]
MAEKISTWFKGLKAEYNKIIWESKESVTKQTVAVVIISVVLGVIIAIVDWILKYGVDFLTTL